MVKRIVLVVVALVIIAWLIALTAATRNRTTSTSREWALGLGQLDDVPKRYPAKGLSDGADRLIDLSMDAGVDLTTPPLRDVPVNEIRVALSRYLEDQLARADGKTDPPPPELAKYLRDHRSALGEVRKHLTSGEPIVWPVDLSKGAKAPTVNLLGQLTLARLLLADSLDALSRDADELAARDLFAVWRFAQTLWPRPELVANLIALSETRMVNVIARRLAARPDWFGEIEQLDIRKVMLTALQAETWAITERAQQAENGEDGEPNAAHQIVDLISKPYAVAGAGTFVVSMREAANEAVADVRCEPAAVKRHPIDTMPWWSRRQSEFSTPNLATIWQRVGRFRAERELTARVFVVKAGGGPPLKSECTDGSWLFDGGTLRFSKPIPVSRPAVSTPLEYKFTNHRDTEAKVNSTR